MTFSRALTTKVMTSCVMKIVSTFTVKIPIVELKEINLKRKKSFFISGLQFGTFLAVASMITGGFSIFHYRQGIENENQKYLKELVSESNSNLAYQYQAEIDRLIRKMVVLGVMELHPLVFSAAADGKTNANPSYSEQIETDSDVLDVSLWKKGEQSNSFDLKPVPKRIYSAMNSKYRDIFPDLSQQVQLAEVAEKNQFASVFEGNPLIFLSSINLGKINFACLVVPLGAGAFHEILVAHFRLGKLQNEFMENSRASGFLVDRNGNILAQTGSSPLSSAKKFSYNPLFQAMRASNQLTGQLSFINETGKSLMGAFSRIQVGQLSVLTTLPNTGPSEVAQQMTSQMMYFLIMAFVFFFVFGYWVIWISSKLFGRDQELSLPSQNSLSGEDDQGIELNRQSLKSGSFTILYCTLRQLNQLLVKTAAEDSIEVINDYFTSAASLVKEFGGIFDRVSEKSFVGVWGLLSSDESNRWHSVLCALKLRSHFFNLNEIRKIDQLMQLSFGLSVHEGPGLVARLGPVKHQRYSIAGDVLNCAKALNRLTVTMRLDLLVSQIVWKKAEGKLIGDPQGQVKLTYDTELTDVYSVSGYRNEQGEVVMVEVPYEPVQFAAHEGREGVSPEVVMSSAPKPIRWFVNNGSQVVGPMSENEIAFRLFSQELDFDCECWDEATGQINRIQDAKIFTGDSDPSGVFLWIYDGETIHGPISKVFIRSALRTGAIQSSVFICEGSTVNGWKKLESWLSTEVSQQLEAKSETDLSQKVDPKKMAASTEKA